MREETEALFNDEGLTSQSQSHVNAQNERRGGDKPPTAPEHSSANDDVPVVPGAYQFDAPAAPPSPAPVSTQSWQS